MTFEKTPREIADGILAAICLEGKVPTKPIIKLCELVSEMTPGELEQFYEWITWDAK